MIGVCIQRLSCLHTSWTGWLVSITETRMVMVKNDYQPSREEDCMTDRSTATKWIIGAGIAVALLASSSLAQPQNDQQSTTTTEGSASRENRSDNTAKFEKKSNKENSKAETDIAKRLNNAANVLDEIMGTPDKGIPKDILADAKCITVIPSMVNIAVGFGGRHGKGVATCRTPQGWSAPAPITIAGGSWGLQIGGEATDLLMLVMNQRGMDHLLSSKMGIRLTHHTTIPSMQGWKITLKT